MFVISCDFEVPALHRLKGHEGACQGIHGHNYLIYLHFSSDSLDSVGRVIDFSNIKKLVGGWLKENWDHACLFSEEDTRALEAIKIFPDLFKKVYLFPGNPTAEIMSREAYLVTRGLLEKNNVPVNVVKTIIYETRSNYAEYTPDGDYTGTEKEID